MTGSAHPFLYESALRSNLDLSRCLHEINRGDHDGELRDFDATTRSVIEHADIPVAGALGRDVADEELRHSVEIRFAHGKPPLCNDDDHATLAGTCINNIDAPLKIRFRAAPCAVPTHSTNNTTAHRIVAARLSGPASFQTEVEL